ncbi:distal tail protein Dit [Cytobacillus sp. FSL R7-0680]|uniref:distal tail protein Dit n=1 Tax=Cytobacillus sp. FSL R7-0680 TaxID=2921689 RepID=UPI0030F9D2F7
MFDISYDEYLGDPFRMIHNGVDLSNYFYVLDVKGRSLSPNEIHATQRSNGSYRFKKRTKTPVPLTVKAIMVCESDFELRERLNELNGILTTDQPVPISFSDEPEFTYNGILSSVTEDGEVNGAHLFTMIFWRPVASKTKETKRLSINSTDTQFIVTGQTETPWTIEVDFTQATSSFKVESNVGLYLLLNYEFIPGDRLLISFDGRKVFLNGNDLRSAVSMSSNYVLLQPGEITLKASHDCDLVYDERYY